MSLTDQRPEDAIAAFLEAIGYPGLAPVQAPPFREAMSKLGAAVHVVTTDGAGGKTGFTATALCSVSDRPPTLLVCLNRGSNSTPALRKNGVLCVNTLRGEEAAIADVFAGRAGLMAADRFAAGQWATLKTGSPVLTSAVVAFDCRVIEIKAVASHDVYFCVVEAIHSGGAGPALVYHNRVYKQL